MNLPPVIRQRYLSQAGLPLAGGQLFTYQAGTTTPQTTYTDQTGGTPNANPIVLDSNGEANMWLDPTLSYKFVLQDSVGNTQWTVDNVVGQLTPNAVNSTSIQNGAVTSAKLAAGSVSVTNLALASDNSVDANRPVGTNNIRDSSITSAKIAAGSINYSKLAGLLAPTAQVFTSGTGVYNKTYLLTVSAANASTAATYTIGGVTYTVSTTISSGNLLQITGPSAPAASGTLTRASGSGDVSIAYTSFAAPLYLRVRLVGAGGGATAANAATTAGTGGSTSFGTSLLSATGGVGGTAAASGSGAPSFGGAGGTATIGTGAIGIAAPGAPGGTGTAGGGINVPVVGGLGGNSPWGGGGRSDQSAVSNSGSGAGGGSVPTSTSGAAGGSGGGSGGYIDAIILSPLAATYAYVIGTAGTGTYSGGSGLIVVEEYYQ